jgi:Ser/Thr protein kinase RdoA (MazF antagonist)
MDLNKNDEVFATTWSLLSDEQLKAITGDGYGLSGSLERLNSERDETFIFKSQDNTKYILKIGNPRERQDLLEFQTGAFLHLERVEPTLKVSRLIRSKQGSVAWTFEGEDGPRMVRLFSYMDGAPLFKVGSSPEQARQLGTVSAILGRGMSTYEARQPEDRILWDMSGFQELCRKLLHHVDPSRHDLILNTLDLFETRYIPVCDDLPVQPIHNDFNPHNILVDPLDHNRISGVIDFGDMVIGTLVSDVGVAMSYLLNRIGDVSELTAFMESYTAIRPLSEIELSVLPVLMRTRLAMTILVAEWRAALFPENKDYILRNHMNAVTALTAIDAVSQSAFQSNASTSRKA